MSRRDDASPPGRRLISGPGLLVLLLGLALCAAAVVWRLTPLLSGTGPGALGDGRDPSTYGFDLSVCTVSRESIVAAGFPRDGIPALARPRFVPAGEVEARNERERGKFLVGGDRVVGVALDGETRAYPLSVLEWHEVVNDEIAGRPVAVTYSPLCDAVAVYDRRLGSETLEFGVSGLLYNSNLLLYDRRDGAGGESLWSQILGRAVAGPAAERGERLELLPAALVRWDVWHRTHPETLVLDRDPAYRRRYRRSPYSSYFGSDLLRFPVDPRPGPDGPPLKTRVVAVRVGDGDLRAWTYPALRALPGAGESRETVLDGTRLRFRTGQRPETVVVEAVDGPARIGVLYAFWFAWYAHWPEAPTETAG